MWPAILTAGAVSLANLTFLALAAAGFVRYLLPAVRRLAVRAPFWGAAAVLGTARVFALKHRYPVDPRQEFLGLGGGQPLGRALAGVPRRGRVVAERDQREGRGAHAAVAGRRVRRGRANTARLVGIGSSHHQPRAERQDRRALGWAERARPLRGKNAGVGAVALTTRGRASRWCCSKAGGPRTSGPPRRRSPVGTGPGTRPGGNAPRRSRPGRKAGCCSRN